MPTVQEFDRKMVKSFLESADLHYLTDSDGDFRIDLPADDDVKCDLEVWLLISDEQEEILSIMIRSDKRIPRQEQGRALLLCNTWNADNYWPTAYLDTEEGSIVLDRAIDFEKGVHQELLDDFVLGTIGTAMTFWQWAIDEKEL
jgi:hypothetical protein